MIGQFIYPEEELAGHKIAVLENAKRNNIDISVDVNETAYGSSFVNYLLFTHWPELVGLATADPKVLYNRYYFFMKFSLLFQSENGRDVGLDQKAFKMLELAEEDLDWGVVEAIDKQLEGG